MDTSSEKQVDPKWGEKTLAHDPTILANFKARETDVLITTPPKAGTTWMQQILHQLRTGGDDSFECIDDVVPWLEVQRQGKHWSEVLEEFETIKEPRVFKTHCTYPQTPGVNTARIILSSRDPRDSCVSLYHHMMSLTEETLQLSNIKKPGSFDEFFETWIDFGGWYSNVSSWWPHINDDNVLWIPYEDMKNNLGKSLDQIVQFLHWDFDERTRERILEYCSFSWMKKNNIKFTHRDENKKPIMIPGNFIRKGEIGDYKSLMNETMEKKLLTHAYETLEPDCIKFLKL